MADAKLERARALLREAGDKKNGGKPTNSGGDNASFPFWDIPENSTATLRFLPDADDNNPWFWVERQTIRLPFNGVVGGDHETDRLVSVTVPCVDMFAKNSCPIIAATRPWWDQEEKKALARTYYKRRSYIFSGFVVNSPFEEQNPPANPIRRFILGKSLLDKVKAALSDPDVEHYPTDYLNGCDFRVRKTKKQDYNNYDTSEWARRSRALTDAEQIAIEQHGLYDLKTFLGAAPDADGVALIKAMFEASVAGDPFDTAAFGKHYRPFGGRASGEAADAMDSAVSAVEARHTPSRETMADARPAERIDTQKLIDKLRSRTGT